MAGESGAACKTMCRRSVGIFVLVALLGYHFGYADFFGGFAGEVDGVEDALDVKGFFGFYEDFIFAASAGTNL